MSCRQAFHYLEQFSSTLPTIDAATALTKLLVVISEKDSSCSVNGALGSYRCCYVVRLFAHFFLSLGWRGSWFFPLIRCAFIKGFRCAIWGKIWKCFSDDDVDDDDDDDGDDGDNDDDDDDDDDDDGDDDDDDDDDDDGGGRDSDSDDEDDGDGVLYATRTHCILGIIVPRPRPEGSRATTLVMGAIAPYLTYVKPVRVWRDVKNFARIDDRKFVSSSRANGEFPEAGMDNSKWR